MAEQRWTPNEIRFAATTLRVAVRDGRGGDRSDEVGEWLRPGFLSEEVAPMLEAFARVSGESATTPDVHLAACERALDVIAERLGLTVIHEEQSWRPDAGSHVTPSELAERFAGASPTPTDLLTETLKSVGITSEHISGVTRWWVEGEPGPKSFASPGEALQALLSIPRPTPTDATPDAWVIIDCNGKMVAAYVAKDEAEKWLYTLNQNAKNRPYAVVALHPAAPAPLSETPPPSPDPTICAICYHAIDCAPAPLSDTAPTCSICGAVATQCDIEGDWWPPCEHAKTHGIATLRGVSRSATAQEPTEPPTTTAEFVKWLDYYAMAVSVLARNAAIAEEGGMSQTPAITMGNESECEHARGLILESWNALTSQLAKVQEYRDALVGRVNAQQGIEATLYDRLRVGAHNEELLTREKAQLEAQLAEARRMLESAWHANAQQESRVAALQADGELVAWFDANSASAHCNYTNDDENWSVMVDDFEGDGLLPQRCRGATFLKAIENARAARSTPPGGAGNA